MKLVDYVTKIDCSSGADYKIVRQIRLNLEKTDKYLQKHGQVVFVLPEKKRKSLLGFLIETPRGVGTVVKEMGDYIEADVKTVDGIIIEKKFKRKEIKPIF